MSSNTNFSFWDYFVFIASLILSSLIGVFYAIKDRKSKNNANYLTGGRKLAVFPVCMSLIASFLSSNTILGTPVEVYLLGTQVTAQILASALSCLLAAHVFMPIYYRLQLTSVNKYLQRRFNSNAIRIVGSIGFILCTLPYMGVVLYGPSLALSAVTPLTITKSILIVGIICTFYTSMGGIKAVIWTDVIQCLLMTVGLLMVIIQGLIEVGGISNAWKIANDGGRIIYWNGELNLYRGDTFWSIFFGGFVVWGGTYCVMQTQVQRYCCMGSMKKARTALYWNIPGVSTLTLFAIMCGIVIYAKYANCDPISLKLIDRADQIMPYFVMETMKTIPGLSGLFVAAVFSGSLSTLSSGMNALATVTWDDILKRYFRTTEERKILMINKITALLYGIIIIGISFIVGRLGTVLQASISLAGAVTGPLFALFCLGIFFPFVNKKGALIGILSGFTLSLWIAFGALIYKRPKLQLPVNVNNCSADVYNMIEDKSIFQQIKTYHFSPTYEPEGILKLYHVSYFNISTIGFVTAMSIGIIGSLIFLLFDSKREPIEPHLLSPLIQYLFPGCLTTKSSHHNDIRQKSENINLPENFVYNANVTPNILTISDSVQNLKYNRKSISEKNAPTKL